MIPVKCAASSERENGTSQNRPKELLLVWTKSLVTSKKNCGYDSGVKMSLVSERAFWGKIYSVQLRRVSNTSRTYLPWLVVCHQMPFFQRHKLQVLQLQSFSVSIMFISGRLNFVKRELKNEESHVNALWRRAIITHQLEKQLVPLSPGV